MRDATVSAMLQKWTVYFCTQRTGLPWAKYPVAAGALAGIITGPLVGFYAGARIFCILGRERLLPPLFAQMSARFGTPAVATAIQALQSVSMPLPPQVFALFYSPSCGAPLLSINGCLVSSPQDMLHTAMNTVLIESPPRGGWPLTDANLLFMQPSSLC